MRTPLDAVCLLLLLSLSAGPSAAAYRDQRHYPAPQPRSAVYDVEVREVDAATLRQLLGGQGGQQQQQQRPQANYPSRGVYPAPGPGAYAYPGGGYPQQQGHFGPQQTPNNGQGYGLPPAPQPGAGAGQTKAHFVSPNGQVYTLKEMNGVRVLVGPDGRWYPLDANGGPSGPGHTEPHGQEADSPTHGSAHGSNHHPPGPSGPNYDADDAAGTGDNGGRGSGPKDTRDAEDCVPSETTYNGGRKACRYQLLLDEHFEVMNLTLWKHDVLMPDEPDFEFVAYDKDPDNSWVDRSILFIKPTILEDVYGPGFVMNGTLSLDGCTSTIPEQCTRTATTYRVLPAVRSARLTTRDTFTFRYGIVEARVLVPEGDWIYPAITLDPASSTYGKWYAGGQIRLPYALGNRFMAKSVNKPKIGLQVLRAGVAIGKAPGQDITPTLVEREQRASNGSDWRKKHFRVYRVKWTPEAIEFYLDGKPMGTIRPPQGGFVKMAENPSDHPWRAGSSMAPFDQEFFISLGVGVGGVNRFADGVTNGEWNEHPKPWKNSSPKALLDFYKASDQWIPTWTHPALEIAHIKVMAL
ncbi:Beta-1,3-glucan-binding protein [Frankliniella fusca]|uniref:Beta-1,3-glucan-binding protein n=1 Tax=Frankliniella fusca TaxID=407009 RepID=A0AAE1LGT0_9NEOP|nr:Beta-1,3-glucan-binding protein [Frankliniella fusca]